MWTQLARKLLQCYSVTVLFFLLLEEELSDLIETTAPGQELVSGALRAVSYSVVASSLEIIDSLSDAIWTLLLTT